MQSENIYWYFQNAISKENCNKIIELGEKKIKENLAEGTNTSGTTFGDTHKKPGLENSLSHETLQEYSAKTGKHPEEIAKTTYIRDSEIGWLSDQWLYDLILPYVEAANKKAGWNYEYDNSENFQFTTYQKGGFYNWHNDGGSCHYSVFKKYIPGISPINPETGAMSLNYTNFLPWVGQVRKLSVTINLNAPGDYEGGNLEFDHGPHSSQERYKELTEIKPQGSLVVFPSYVYHRVLPVTKGKRKSLVLWCIGRPFK